MKIAVLAFSFIPHMGGAQIFTYNLLKNLAQRSHEVHLFLPSRWYKKYTSLLLKNDFKVFPIFIKEERLVNCCSSVISLSLLIRQLVSNYDLWQIIGAYPAGYVARILTARVPAVLRSYGKDIQKEESLGYGDRLNPKVEKKIKKTLLKMSRLVALTPTVEKSFLELAVPKEKIIEIPNGVDLERFQAPVDRLSVRRRLGVEDDDVLLLSVGRYHKKKGYELIPEAAKLLIGRGHKIRWVLIGKDVKRIKPLVDTLQLGEVIIFKGTIGAGEDCIHNGEPQLPSNELIEIYKSADIFVMPSLLETFGMVLIEAMASGLPVVTTDAPGCHDVVQHEVNGLLSKPSDSISLAQNIERILKEKNLSERIISRAKTTVKDYDWQKITDKYEKLYFDIAQKKH